MSASTDWEFSDSDWKELLKAIERKPGASGMRDAFSYSLGKAGDAHSTPVSIQNIPEKYRAVFKELFDNMKSDDGSPRHGGAK